MSAEWEKAAVAAGWHSPEFCIMFLGWLCGKLPELHELEAPRVLDAWREFERDMAQRADSRP